MQPKSIPTQLQSLSGLYSTKEKSTRINCLVYIFISTGLPSLVSDLQPHQERCFYNYKIQSHRDTGAVTCYLCGNRGELRVELGP